VIGPTAVAAPTNLGNDGKGVNGFARYWDGPAGAPWLYNPTLDGGTFISYMDPPAVVERAQLVAAKHLRGLWAWEVSQDDDAGDLVAAMSSGRYSPDLSRAARATRAGRSARQASATGSVDGASGGLPRQRQHLLFPARSLRRRAERLTDDASRWDTHALQPFERRLLRR
jgi:hypothetical protein